jgi:glycine betaine/proline transport system substrate-binding protein
MEKKQRNLVIGVLIVVAILIVAAIAVLGLGDNGDDEGEPIQFGYVLWEGEIAATNVMTLVLEEAGFEVDMVNVDAGIMYQSLASGDLDISVSAWLPATQANYWEVYGDDIDDVGINLEGCSIGLVVPTYLTNVNSIYDLANYSNEFQDRIVGIDPGAGMMTNTQDAIDEYGLESYELLASSSAGMLAELSAAYDETEHIVVTLWSPHWAFAEWDLKYLDDPLGCFGEEEYVHSLAREGFQDDNPEAYAILERFSWTQDDIQSVMADIAGDMGEVEAAQKWIDDNRDVVDYWLYG